MATLELSYVWDTAIEFDIKKAQLPAALESTKT